MSTIGITTHIYMMHEFYDIPDEVKQLLPNQNAALTGYCAPMNLKLIEAEFHQYIV